MQALAGGCLKRLAALPIASPAGPVPPALTGRPDDLALVIATSGSEGEAKAVMLSNTNIDVAARAANRCLSLSAGERLADLPDLGNERDRCAGGDTIAARQ